MWNRIYAASLVHHLDELKAAAPGHEIVYVPSHRSHMDYLLLSTCSMSHGVVPPHIVAGVNLNLPVIGTLLRRGGAFFLRRSFRGNALYSAVFREYLAQLIDRRLLDRILHRRRPLAHRPPAAAEGRACWR